MKSVALALGLSCVVSCNATVYQAKFTQPIVAEELDVKAPFLKCHMKDGSVYVLKKWWVEVGKKRVSGAGVLYNADRARVREGEVALALDDVAIFETNHPESVPRNEIPLMAVVTGVSLVVTAACIANPKSCFGSCPTFYAHDGERVSLQAEGFSSAVARTLEETDVDAMWTARASGASRTFDVTMTNEALETHAVNSVRVLAAPRPPGARVLRAGARYFPATRLTPPSGCLSALGDCTADVAATDTREYKSPAGASDLGEKETIDLAFSPRNGDLGLAVVARNSLLNTFLFYQALAYMGRSAGEWMARLERSGVEGLTGIGGVGERLGDIEVDVWTKEGTWRHAGAFAEVGPIAREAQLVVLGAADDLAGGDVRVRLTMTKGNWKIDQLALAELGAAITPVALDPDAVLRRGSPDDDARRALLDPARYLVTMPGDAYTLRFTLPDGDQELFLESRGYYYEWMRDEWLKDESPTELLRMLADPAGAMRRLAPKYKRIEGDMDRIFWESRFGGHR